jgi:uncharacterized damage-inducible protein DinB
MGLITKSLAMELEMEAATARRCIERFKDDQLGWKPHAKSMSVGQLISHLAEIPSWAVPTFQQDSLDLSTYVAPNHATVAEVLAAFDASVAAAKEAIASADEATFGDAWSLGAGGHTFFTMPRAAVMRAFVLSHFIHHRGQLSVYLRLLDIPVPSIYGPTADEGM